MNHGNRKREGGKGDGLDSGKVSEAFRFEKKRKRNRKRK